VVPEPPGGAHADPADAAQRVRAALVSEVDELCRLDVATLLALRTRRLSRIGGDEARPLRVVPVTSGGDDRAAG
jgi:acetyl-CoA carboxylase carboxyl transferase subunit beta